MQDKHIHSAQSLIWNEATDSFDKSRLTVSARDSCYGAL